MRELVSTFGEKKVSGQEGLANRKAELLYQTLDTYPEVYTVVPNKAVRSRMNVCFRVHGGDEAREKEFLAKGEERGLTGLKGHRSVGGIRASNYNAVPLVNVEKLCAFLVEFAKL
jgi:phosphoserine aminotransferase